MTPVPLNKQVLADIAELYGVLEKHLAYDEANCKKIDLMYKVLVTGNGQPSLPEIVRSQGAWIEEKKDEEKTAGARGFEMKKGVILLVLGQIAAIGGSAAAIYLGLKK